MDMTEFKSEFERCQIMPILRKSKIH